jgi:hypothetical protein
MTAGKHDRINHSVCKWRCDDIPLEKPFHAARKNRKHVHLSPSHRRLSRPRRDRRNARALLTRHHARAIADNAYQGFIGQEFITKRPDKLVILRQGV